MAKQTITFVLDTNRDRDVLRWLEGQANKSLAIREAIRAQMDRADVTLRDVLAAIQDLKRHNGRPAATGEGAAGIGDEPADVAVVLDSLGL